MRRIVFLVLIATISAIAVFGQEEAKGDQSVQACPSYPLAVTDPLSLGGLPMDLRSAFTMMDASRRDLKTLRAKIWIDHRISLHNEQQDLKSKLFHDFGDPKKPAPGKEHIGAALAFLNTSSADITAKYRTKFIGVNNTRAYAGAAIIVLRPKTPGPYKSVLLWIDNKGMVLQVGLTVQKDDIITVTLTDVEKNVVQGPSDLTIASGK